MTKSPPKESIGEKEKEKEKDEDVRADVFCDGDDNKLINQSIIFWSEKKKVCQTFYFASLLH